MKKFRKTPSGKYLVEFRKGRDPARPNARSKTFDTEEDAREYWNSLPDRRKKQDEGGISFFELANKYTVAKIGESSETDQDNNYYKLKSIIFPQIGMSSAAGINHNTLDKYIMSRLQDNIYVYMGPNIPRKKTDRKVSISTIRRELEIIRAILNWGVERGYLVSSPMVGYKMPSKRGRIVLPPTEDDYRSILKHAAPHCKRFIMLSYYTGLRPGKVEAFGLKWEHVDFENETIQIISAEKGGVPLRVISLHENLLYAMKWWKACDEQRGYKNGYIIHYQFKQVGTSMKTAWKNAKRRAGITKKLPPYSLRHKTATDLLKYTGGDVKTAADILGNDPKTLMEYYQTVDTEQKRNAVRGLK